MFKKSLLTICLLFNLENSPMFQKTMVAFAKKQLDEIEKAAKFLSARGCVIKKQKHNSLSAEQLTRAGYAYQKTEFTIKPTSSKSDIFEVSRKDLGYEASFYETGHFEYIKMDESFMGHHSHRKNISKALSMIFNCKYWGKNFPRSK